MESSLTPFFSVCIPVWGIKGNGVDYLEYSLNILAHQQFKDFEVVISDHSTDEYLKECCDEWSNLLNINYIKCETGRGKISPNLNNAIRNCKGKYIKILFQDDLRLLFFSISSLLFIIL
jgi:glycosyltransferase involved in cell wall biosynthesis